MVPKHLLAKIFERLDDDAPRLVLADWLTEQGDPRGEFIQLQCALGRGVSGAFARQVAEAEKALLKRWEKKWLEPVRQYLLEWGFRRGFLEKVVCAFSGFVDGLEALAAEPIEKVQLSRYRRPPKKLHECPPHPTAWLIDVSDNRLEASDLELVGSRCFSRLTGLDLGQNRFGDAGAMVVAPLLPRTLRRLSVASNQLTDAAVAALAKSAAWPRLTHLSLGYNAGIGDAAIDALASAKSLEWLQLSGTAVSGAGAARLARLALPALETLSIRVRGLGAAGGRALVESASLSGLKILELADDTDRKVRAAALARLGAAPEPKEAVFFR